MNILMNGYFDKNFGDDVMHCMVVSQFKDHNFYINTCQREMLSHLEMYENVFINSSMPPIDMFLNVIGTGFMYNSKRAKLEKLLSIMRTKQKKYPKTALLNCSLERFNSRLSKSLTKYDLNKYDFITCRDKVTYEYLKKNIKNAEIFCYEDMVFSGDYIFDCPKKYLGIAPVRRLYSDTNFEYYKEMAKLADLYAERENKAIRIFAFDSGLENDISAALSIKEMMKYKDMAEIIIYNSNPIEFVKNIAECDCFVGSRFHSMVIALMNDIKCAAVYDNAKIERLCEDFGIVGVEKHKFKAEEIYNSFKAGTKSHTDANGHIKMLEKFIAE